MTDGMSELAPAGSVPGLPGQDPEDDIAQIRVRKSGRMKLNPEPLAVVADRESGALSALAEHIRATPRADRLRLWLAQGGSKEEFDEQYPDGL